MSEPLWLGLLAGLTLLAVIGFTFYHMRKYCRELDEKAPPIPNDVIVIGLHSK